MKTKQRTKSNEENFQNKRDKIITAAKKCIMKKGFHSTTMPEIANRANISVGHIYSFFGNKDDLILAIVESIVQNQLSWIEKEVDEQHIADSHINFYFKNYMSEKESRALMLETLAEAERNKSVSKQVKDVDKACQKIVVSRLAGLFPDLPEEEIKVRVEIMAMLFESILIRTVKEPDVDRELLQEELRKIINFLWGQK